MKEDNPKKVLFRHTLTVGPDHLDELEHVNNVVYLQWVNDISGMHWNQLSAGGLKEKYFWVVIRHELDYLNQAVLHDELDLTTWVGESKGVKSIRHVEIYRGETLLVRAASTWCLIDAKTLRPTRIKRDILNTLYPDQND